MNQNAGDEGFTLIETVITLVVAAIFLMSINTIFITIIRSTASSRNHAEASNEAYTYLRKYAYAGAVPTWFTCTAANDMQQNPSTTGQVLEGGSLNAAQTPLPQPVSYTVNALSPYGCTSGTYSTPVMVRASITYGPDRLMVQQATYVSEDS